MNFEITNYTTNTVYIGDQMIGIARVFYPNNHKKTFMTCVIRATKERSLCECTGEVEYKCIHEGLYVLETTNFIGEQIDILVLDSIDKIKKYIQCKLEELGSDYTNDASVKELMAQPEDENFAFNIKLGTILTNEDSLRDIANKVRYL